MIDAATFFKPKAQPSTEAAGRDRDWAVPNALLASGAVAWLLTTGLAWNAGALRWYNDALSHEQSARRVFDALQPGVVQLGTVWLPLPHLLLLPLTAIEPIWQAGLAGAVSGLLYLLLTIGSLYITGRSFGGRAAGWIAAIVLLLNPNTLYLFATPMTEAPMLAFTCAGAAALAVAVRRLQAGGLPIVPIAGAGCAMGAAILCRYDGWLLAGLAGVLLGGLSYWLLRDRAQTEAALVLYAPLPVYAVVLWLLYNQMFFGDWLAFARGEYSSAHVMADLAANGAIPVIDGRPPERDQPLVATLTYLQSVIETAGWAPVALGAAGCCLALVRWPRRPALLVVPWLATPLLFYAIALTRGESVIVTRAAHEDWLFNVRYGVALAPLLATGAAALASPLGRRAWLAVAGSGLAMLVSSGALWLAPGGPVVLAEGALQHAAAGPGRDAGAWLASQPDDGLVLIDDVVSDSKVILAHGERPLSHYVTIGSAELWERSVGPAPTRAETMEQAGEAPARASLQELPMDITWVVILQPASRFARLDRVRDALVVAGTIEGFDPVYANHDFVIFRRAPADQPIATTGAE